MTGENHFSRRIVAGNILKPWLILGPFYEDLGAVVQGLTLFERSGATVGVAAMEEIVTQARPILASSPQEGTDSKKTPSRNNVRPVSSGLATREGDEFDIIAQPDPSWAADTRLYRCRSAG